MAAVNTSMLKFVYFKMLQLRVITPNVAVYRRLCSQINVKASDTNTADNYDELIISGKKRVLKVAIVGAPNAGKSTLVNRIVGGPVLCVSKKVHTTRKRERAALVRHNAQILFVDTPGLVTQAEMKRFQLEPSFREGALRAINEAHVVGIIHDASNIWTRHRFHKNIIEILSSLGPKEVFLVLNKVDAIESKKKLLDLVGQLTCTEPAQSECLLVPRLDELETERIEKKSQKTLRNKLPKFSEVFMLSALKGDGVPDMIDYLVAQAKEGKWVLPPGKVTDRSWPVVLQELVRGRLLDALPQEVPYSLKIETEYFHINDLGEVISVVLVTCPLLRHQKILLSGNGRTIRKVAELAEKDARNALSCHVRLRIVVISSEDKEQSIDR